MVQHHDNSVFKISRILCKYKQICDGGDVNCFVQKVKFSVSLIPSIEVCVQITRQCIYSNLNHQVLLKLMESVSAWVHTVIKAQKKEKRTYWRLRNDEDSTTQVVADNIIYNEILCEVQGGECLQPRKHLCLHSHFIFCI